MRSSRQLLLSLLAPFILLFGNDQLVSGGSIPARHPEYIRRRTSDSNSTAVAVPGLRYLSQYVCPPGDANVKRQTIDLPPITIPKDQLRDVLLQIRILELQFVALIDTILLDDGLGLANSSLLNIRISKTSTICLDSLSSSVNSALAATSIKTTPTSTTFTTSTLPAPSTTIIPTTTNFTTSALADPSTSTTWITTTFTPRITVTVTPSVIPPATPLSVDASSTATILTSTTASTSVDALSTTTTDSLLPSTSVDALRTTTTDSLLPSTSTQVVSGGIFIETTTTPSPAAETTGSTGTEYVFDAQSSKNIAVYFGQSPVTGQTTLAAQCSDPNIDIVMLAFVISVTEGGQYPTVNFGAACGGQTAEMIAQAPGLLTCPELASNIATCQSTYGKKVLLSIGGATSQISFSTTDQAIAFADVLWNLFGPAGNVDLGLRPFGSISIDGFDIDNEDNMPANYDILGSTLRTRYATDTSKKYYLSSAPQCPFPDASNPSGLLLLCDFVFVQFYNNPQCEIGSSGFTASLNTWSTAMQGSTLDEKPRVYVGAPAFSEAGRSAYANIGNAEGMMSVAKEAKGLGLSNFGGVMFWDGPEGMLNEEGGKDIIAWAKEGLN